MADLDEMVAVVQAYIQDKKGKRVYIVFNDVRKFSDHLEMLRLAYHHVIKENESRNNRT